MQTLMEINRRHMLIMEAIDSKLIERAVNIIDRLRQLAEKTKVGTLSTAVENARNDAMALIRLSKSRKKFSDWSHDKVGDPITRLTMFTDALATGLTQIPQIIRLLPDDVRNADNDSLAHSLSISNDTKAESEFKKALIAAFKPQEINKNKLSIGQKIIRFFGAKRYDFPYINIKQFVDELLQKTPNQLIELASTANEPAKALNDAIANVMTNVADAANIPDDVKTQTGTTQTKSTSANDIRNNTIAWLKDKLAKSKGGVSIDRKSASTIINILKND